ncbi:sigma-54-dependent transcriptional regulator [Limnoglobus roseus]|uniref:Sigma-54-dependent Fis family transcriptional regulator n=1 Tax=Limnoglobus roseus TaxID=2598579 RepID=A0A5C1APD9_9BACT|nr:sigma-54 dependent transcriptional regulator [Limnoglobus roseus]QEL20003.1 sigma-54-dependent Fis family transcriptional regulator [Limnoglobus roseus]
MSNDPIRVLVIDDDRNFAQTIAEALAKKGNNVVTVANSGAAGSQKIEDGDYEVVLTDLKMADVDGLSIVKLVREKMPDAQVYVITGQGDVKTAVEAMKAGAEHYIIKDKIVLDEIRAIVEKSAERVRLAAANRELRRQLDEKFGFEGVVGNSRQMQDVLRKLKAFAPSPATVLILGENGTGKELAAKALHTNSPRKNKPFVAMNCAALNENLLDDEMFGHVPGAFTDARGERKGRFEYANGGTLFLDEIGDMPVNLQAKLLRTLENGEVTRIGANSPIKVDVRLIAATNRDLDAMVKDGKFRLDLLHRLKVAVVRLPALRERRDDLPLLFDHFLKELCARHHKAVPKVAEAVRRAFAAYPWPGNVREMRNTMESMVLLDSDDVLGVDDLPEEFSHAPGGPPPASLDGANDGLIGRPLHEVERYYTEKALELTKNNREEAAKLLQIGERTLYRNLLKWKNEE